LERLHITKKYRLSESSPAFSLSPSPTLSAKTQSIDFLTGVFPMVASNARLNLPSSAERPNSDDTPLDNKDQIGRYSMVWGALQQEALAWFDQNGNRDLMPDDQERQQRILAEQRQQQAAQRQQAAEQQQEKLAAKLRELGVDPDTI
jgi:hypothetical protein